MIENDRKLERKIAMQINLWSRALKSSELWPRSGGLSAKAVDGGLNHSVRHGIKKAFWQSKAVLKRQTWRFNQQKWKLEDGPNPLTSLG